MYEILNILLWDYNASLYMKQFFLLMKYHFQQNEKSIKSIFNVFYYFFKIKLGNYKKWGKILNYKI